MTAPVETADAGGAAPGKAAFTLRGHNPDVLTCIANLSNDEVFTPPDLANQMLDTLADAWAEAHEGASIWSDPTVTFLDPFTKSGVFLREITSRLVAGLTEQIPDLQERVDHILTQQVFGIGITSLTALLARRSVYCSKYANGPHSIAKSFDRDWGNIWFERTEHTWAGPRCVYCPAQRERFDRPDELETHAYAFIHTSDIKARLARMFGAEMQFDVIIGNPPYQLEDDGFGSSAAPIYQKFVEQAKALEPRIVSMVVPARWYAGGKGLDDFRASMLRESRVRFLHDFPNTADVFPRNVNNRGGICYFVWERDYRGPAEVATHEGDLVTSIASRSLLEPGLDTFIRYNEGVKILNSVLEVEYDGAPVEMRPPPGKRFGDLVSPRNPFGLSTNARGRPGPALAGEITVHRNGGTFVVPADEVRDSLALVDAHKLLVARASPGSDEYPHLVLSRPIVAGRREAATDTYIAIGPFPSDEEARRAAEYMSTIFFRFMVSLMRVSINVTRTVYQLVPVQDFARTWSDDELARRYGLSEDDRDFMARFVKPVSWAGSFL
jgi:hypothetical protein